MWIDWSPDELRERADRLPGLHRLHGVAAGAAARLDMALGRRWAAVSRLQRAWRYAGEARVNPTLVLQAEGLIRAACYRGSELAPLAENGFVGEFLRSREARALRRFWDAVPLEHRVRLRKPRPEEDPERQGNLMALKSPDPSKGEKGVLLAMYSPTFPELVAVFDHARLFDRYRLVLEPSTWGYQDPALLLYLGAEAEVVVLAQRREDYEYLLAHGRNLKPLRLGAGDWIDPGQFRPAPREGFDFDLVMVSAWDPVKRHHALFEALRRLRDRHGRVLRAALVGYPMRWRRERIEAMMRRWGVAEQCTLFELVPPSRVAEIVSRSAVSLLLSHREGANRAIYESLFCDTPVLVPRHHIGVNLDHVNADTGLLFDDDALAPALLAAIDGRGSFRPRAWALANTGWANSTRRLNSFLREMALGRGEPWTRDIAERKNAPNLRYVRPGAYREFEAAHLGLEEYLRRGD